jgi:hypothetical protein
LGHEAEARRDVELAVGVGDAAAEAGAVGRAAAEAERSRASCPGPWRAQVLAPDVEPLLASMATTVASPSITKILPSAATGGAVT